MDSRIVEEFLQKTEGHLHFPNLLFVLKKTGSHDIWLVILELYVDQIYLKFIDIQTAFTSPKCLNQACDTISGLLF